MSPSSHDIALQAFRKHAECHPLIYYTGILSLQGFARLAVESGDTALIREAREHLFPFVLGEREFRCNYANYLCGGNGSAYLAAKGHFPEAMETLSAYAEKTIREIPRDRQGLMAHTAETRERIFIDVIFALCPFLVNTGLALNERRYVDEAVHQALGYIAVLTDSENGLLHQGRGFYEEGRLSEDHWSRGNGWGLLALAELTDALPIDHPKMPEIRQALTSLLRAALRWQDPEGMWHQEITQHDTYTETSGTGLILFALAVAISKGWMDDVQAFDRGLAGYLRYIDPDGTIHNTCRSCLCPGAGTIADYLGREAVVNDPHAFGPVILAFGAAAHRLKRPLHEPMEAIS